LAVPELPVLTERQIIAARTACAPRTPKVAAEEEVARLIWWANKNNYGNIAGSLHYIRALLGSMDDPGQ
jgi:hypothetical protein